MRRRGLIVTVLVMWVMVAVPTQSGATANGPRFDIKPQAALSADGTVITLDGKASCPAGMEVLEAFVYVTQDGNESEFGFFGIPCDDHKHHVTIPAHAFEEQPFHEGVASASGYLLVVNPATQETQDVSPVQRLRLRR